MEYFDFEQKIVNELRNFYGDDAGANVCVYDVQKLNGRVLRALRIDFNNDEDCSREAVASPVFYLEEMYRRFEGGEFSLETIIGKIVDLRSKDSSDIVDSVESLSDFEKIKEDIFPLLLNESTNKTLLETLAHTHFCDLACIYYIRLDTPSLGIGSVKITNEMLGRYGISLDELHSTAIRNMKNDGYKIESIENVLKQMLIMKEYEDKDEIIEKLDENTSGMFIISNASRVYGAAGIMNPELLEVYSGGDDIYVIPSSVHECILIKAKGVSDAQILNAIITEINREQVSPEEVLSNHAYLYKAKERKIEEVI